LIGIYTGDQVPGLIQSSFNSLTFRFFSDGATVDAGWRAVYDTMPVSSIREKKFDPEMNIWPNPTSGDVHIEYPRFKVQQGSFFMVIDAYGATREQVQMPLSQDHIILDTSSWPAGIYFAVIYHHGIKIGRGKIIVR